MHIKSSTQVMWKKILKKKITERNFVIKMEHPIRTKMTVPVTLCSKIPIVLGVSPGMVDSDVLRRAITWFIDRTVAATNQGKPKRELIPMQIATTNKSR